MKELELKQENKTEISVKQQKQVEYEYVGNITPHDGHSIWEINVETLEIAKAKYANSTYVFGGENKNEIVIKKGHSYVSALNKKNALKKYKEGKTGGKPITVEPLTINPF